MLLKGESGQTREESRVARLARGATAGDRDMDTLLLDELQTNEF